MNQPNARPDDYRVPAIAQEQALTENLDFELSRIRDEALNAAADTHEVVSTDIDQHRVEFGSNIVEMAGRRAEPVSDVAPAVAQIELPTDPASLKHIGSLCMQMRQHEMFDGEAA